MIVRTLLLLAGFCLASAPVAAADHGVILLYHHVSDSTPPSTSVTPQRFQQHLDYLAEHNFNVISLDQLLSAGLSGSPLPDNAVAITFDDAYLSVFTEAAPRLQKKDWPFTVFLASQPLDDRVAGFMSWQQAEKLLAMGGAIGAHSHTHGYLARQQEGESASQWQQRVEREIDDNLQRIEAELDVAATSFAYPFGEYNNFLKEALEGRNLYGLAQQSGAVGGHTDPRQIPRFPLATGYDDLDRLKLAVNSRPLPVVEEKRDGQLLMLEMGNSDLPAINCFSSGGRKLNLQKTHNRDYRIKLPPTAPGRNKINCTAPSKTQRGEFYWYSYLWMGD